MTGPAVALDEPLLEISTADPKLGAVFYTLQMSPRHPQIRRENFRCLGCHEATVDHGKIPMHTIRRVMTRSNGNINLLLDSFVTDHTSPIQQRWGGWFVTGGHGAMKHMGNAFLEGDGLVSLGDSNVATLSGQFDLASWPVASSDIVSLMVLEHQTQMHNQLASADYAVRRAIDAHEQGLLPDGKTLESIIDASAKKVVDHLLFVDETTLDSEITCSNSFTHDFQAKGPIADDGASLREFDLKNRLFRYPCSYVIYSPSFSQLELALQAKIYARLWRVLNGEDRSEEYARLSLEDRSSVRRILAQTIDSLPDYWMAD